MQARTRRCLIVMLLGLHVSLLAWQSKKDGPTWDEIGHIAAGFEHWRHWQFELFSVNPPLVRLVATLPVAFCHTEIDPQKYLAPHGPGQRPEFPIGIAIAQAAGNGYFDILTYARYTSLIFSILGGYICYRWASETWGSSVSGLIALGLWCSSPTVLAYGHLVLPDLGAAAMGITALYGFRRWLLNPTIRGASIVGFLVGLAELTKSTWVVLVVLIPCMWIAFRITTRNRRSGKTWMKEGGQVTIILLLKPSTP